MDNFIYREKIHPPFLSPHHKGGGGGGKYTPIKKCAKKRRIGTTNANLCALICTVVTSATTPLAIGGVTDKDGEQKPAPVHIKLEGLEGGK